MDGSTELVANGGSQDGRDCPCPRNRPGATLGQIARKRMAPRAGWRSGSGGLPGDRRPDLAGSARAGLHRNPHGVLRSPFPPARGAGAGAEELSPEQTELAEQLSLEWLHRAETRSSNAVQRQIATVELNDLRPDPARQPQGLCSAVRAVWKRLARLRWFARLGNDVVERFVLPALSQVTRYLTDDQVRADIQKIVRDLIKDDTRVVIGHSLGSIVAYEVAHQLQRPLPLLVTLGSPLGVETVVLQRLRPPASFPAQVRRWVNVADTDDLVAAEPNLTSLFAATMPREAIFEGAYTVDNGAEPHSAKFYLGKDHVGRPVGQVFSTVDRTP